MHARLLCTLTVLALDVCSSDKKPEQKVAEQPAAAEKKRSFDKLNRLDFNRRAAERYLNVFWRTDANKNGALDADELAVLWGYGDLKKADLVDAKGFTPRFAKLYDELVSPDAAPPDAAEKARRETIKQELAQ